MILRHVKLTVHELKRLVAEALKLEWAGAPPTKPEPYIGNSMSPSWSSREQLASLKDNDVDTVDDFDELPSHLREPVYDKEECFGPVPPDVPDPYVQQDPYARDYSPLPTSGIRRG